MSEIEVAWLNWGVQALAKIAKYKLSAIGPVASTNQRGWWECVA